MSTLSSGPRAVYLAIGTELTSGQVTNGNAAWIAAQLESIGIVTDWQLCVPDHRALMREAMEMASSRGDLIFITGGLGPTTDDFTREVVAEWWGEKLEWYEPSWKKAVERLAARGITPPESSKQQAWYPRGAQVLPNREGTADAFVLERSATGRFAHRQMVFVLPGPPREIEVVWQDHVAPMLSRAFGPLRSIEPLRWTLLGRSEAQLGDAVEEAVRGTGLVTGYRATPPYVEIKIWIPEGMRQEDSHIQNALQRLEVVLSPWVVARGDEDVLDRFFSEWNTGPLLLVDRCSLGQMSHRVWAWAKSNPSRMARVRDLGVAVRTEPFQQLDEALEVSSGSVLELGPLVQQENHAYCQVRTLKGSSLERVEEFSIPFPQSMRDRQVLFAVEKFFTLKRT